MAIVRISDRKWKLFEAHFMDYYGETQGRPPKWPLRHILEAVVWILHTGAQWRCLPKNFPPYQTVHYWFQKWQHLDVFSDFRRILTQAMERFGHIHKEEAFIDATFVRSLSGGEQVGCTKLGKGVKVMAIVDKNSHPISLYIGSANPHELQLLPPTVDNLMTKSTPKFLIGDRAYDSDVHDLLMREAGITLVAPHKKNRIRHTQYGRSLRRYARRWHVERFFAWTKWFRRLVIRFEKRIENFIGFFELGAALILISKFP